MKYKFKEVNSISVYETFSICPQLKKIHWWQSEWRVDISNIVREDELDSGCIVASSESWLLTLSSCCLCDRNIWANVTIYDWDYCQCEERVKYKRRGSSVWSLCFLDVINQSKHLRVIIICCSTENDHFALRNQAASASKVIICFRNCAVLILLAMLWVFFILVKKCF